jgi:hypothetical protein
MPQQKTWRSGSTYETVGETPASPRENCTAVCHSVKVPESSRGMETVDVACHLSVSRAT